MKACREVEQLREVEATWIGGEVGVDSESCNRQEFFMAGGTLVSSPIVTSVPSAETLACRWFNEACCSNVRTWKKVKIKTFLSLSPQSVPPLDEAPQSSQGSQKHPGNQQCF